MVPCQGAGIPVLSTVAEEMGRARGQLVPSTQSLEEAHSCVLGCLGDTAGPSPCAQGPPVGCSQSRFLEGTTSLGLTGAGQLGNCCITSHRKQRKGWEWMCGGMRKSRVAWPAARRWGAPQPGAGWPGVDRDPSLICRGGCASARPKQLLLPPHLHGREAASLPAHNARGGGFSRAQAGGGRGAGGGGEEAQSGQRAGQGRAGRRAS